MDGSAPLPRGGAPARLLALLSMALGSVAALLLLEGAFRILDIKATEPGRIFRISNGPDVLFPGRARHTVIDLYATNPRGSFPVDLTSSETREQLLAEKFTRVDEARRTNPFGVVFKYNARGFREREFAPKEAAMKRVVFLGDSFTEGMGVNEAFSSVRLVEGLFRRDGVSIEAFNLGVRALDFPQLEELVDPALDLSPDVVILAFVLNDADRNSELTNRWPRVNDWIMVRQKAPAGIETYSFLAGFLADRYESYRASRDATAWYRALYTDENRDGWMRTRAALDRMRKKLAVQGVSFGVALWPLLVGLESDENYPFEAAHAQIKRGMERSGIPFIDLLPALKGRDSASLWVHPSDLHPNEIAQGLVAPVLAEFARLRLQEAAKPQPVAK